MECVIDASVVLAWCFTDESTPATKKILDDLLNHSSYVPSIWPLEIGNALLVAKRRKRITAAKINEFLTLLANLNIQVDDQTTTRAFHEILALASTHELTTYDAAYLELAMRLGLPLVSKDTQLCKAGKLCGVIVIN